MRKKLLLRMFLATLGFVTANFVYQAIGPEHWVAAIERSYFGGLLAMILMFVVAGNVPRVPR